MTDVIETFLRKHPSESLLYDFKFSEKLGTNTLQTGEAASSTKLGRIAGSANLTISNVNRSGTIVQVRFAGGTDDEDYRVAVTCPDSQGNTLVIEAILQVRTARFQE